MSGMTRDEAVAFIRSIPRRAEHEWTEEWGGMVDAALDVLTAPPRIEMIVVRDPDSETEVQTFVNGAPIGKAVEYHLDPGAGYERYDWTVGALAELAVATPGPVRDALVRAYKDADDSSYITGGIECENCETGVQVDYSTGEWSHLDPVPCIVPVPEGQDW